MPYSLNVQDQAQPLDTDKAKVLGAEMREVKRFITRIPVRPVSANTSITPADGGSQIRHPAADVTGRTWDIALHAGVLGDATFWQDGSIVTLVNKNGAGAISITSGNTVRLAGTGTTGTRILAPNGVANLLWDLVELEWLIDGTGVS